MPANALYLGEIARLDMFERLEKHGSIEALELLIGPSEGALHELHAVPVESNGTADSPLAAHRRR